MLPSRMDPATFQLVAQSLACPQNITINSYYRFLSHPAQFLFIQFFDAINNNNNNNNNLFNCKWAVARWQWLLCIYIIMK
jgi:hypothetical protein